MARILEWVAITFSRGFSQPRNRTRVSCIVGRFFTDWAMREALLLRDKWMLKKWSESHSFMSDSLLPHGLYSPWNSPGLNTGVGSCFLFQGIFSTQGLNPDLPCCRWILYQLSHQGSLLNINPFISSNIVSRVVSKSVSDNSTIWSDWKSISSGSLFFCVVLNFYQNLLTSLRKMVLGIWGDWGGRNPLSRIHVFLFLLCHEWFLVGSNFKLYS